MANGHADVLPPEDPDPSASRRIVARINQGDVAAFEEFYTTLYPELLRAAARLMHSRALAEEVVQDVFIWVWTHRAQWTIRTTVRAYLHSAIRHRAATVLRSEIAQRGLEAEDEDEPIGHSEPLLTPDEILETANLQETLRRVIRALPPRQQEALILWTRYGMTLTELGEALGISHVAARKLLLKAQTTLQAVIDQANRS